MSSLVLDASSILALLHREDGTARVEAAVLAGASISTVNLSEVVAKLADSGMDEQAIRETLENLRVTVVPFDENQAVRAGLLRVFTRKLGLSFGDRACIALAQELGLPILTADRIWGQLNIGIGVHLLR